VGLQRSLKRDEKVVVYRLSIQLESLKIKLFSYCDLKNWSKYSTVIIFYSYVVTFQTHVFVTLSRTYYNKNFIYQLCLHPAEHTIFYVWNEALSPVPDDSVTRYAAL
jgi:hypothetical protein